MDTAQDIQKRMTIRALTGPIFVETFLRMLFLNIDVYMLQFYSGKAVAAMGPIMQLYFCMVIVMMVSTSGAGILIAQNLGAKRYGVAAEYSLASLVLVFVSGIVVGVVVHMNSAQFLGFFGLEEAVHAYAQQYMMVMGGGSLIVAFSVGITSVARSYGYARLTLYASIVGNLLNAFGNYCFIFGAFGLPILGVKGVALSTLAGNLLSGAFITWFLLFKFRLKLPFRDLLRIPVKYYWQILRIGGPSAGEMLSFNLAQMVTMHFIARMGTPSLTAFVCAINIQRFIFMFSISIGQAVQILVGFLVGSRQPEEAYRRTLAGLWFAIAITLVVAGIAAIFRETFLGLFTRDAEVIRLGGTLLLIALLLEPFRAFNIILGGALRGAGDYQFPIMIGVASMWGVSVVLSYYLGIYWALGVAGVWFAFATDEGLRGLLMLARWRSRIWERKAMVSATE